MVELESIELSFGWPPTSGVTTRPAVAQVTPCSSGFEENPRQRHDSTGFPAREVALSLHSGSFAILVFGDGSCQYSAVENQTQRIEPLQEVDRQRLDECRRFVESLVDPASTPGVFESSAGKLKVLQAILDQGVFAKDQTVELRSLGVVLGDVIASELMMEWIIVIDEYGRDAAISTPSRKSILFPLTMISKRIERGESFDLFDFCNWTIAKVQELESVVAKP